jgi:drug/metabolite transporter (DMT)-like permease
MTKRTKAYLALLTTAIIWGAAFPIVKPSLDYISPFQFLYFRYLIAAPLTLPIIIYYYRKLKPSLKTITKIISLELFGSPFALSILYFGLSRTSALEGSLITATSPIITTIGGIIYLKEKEEKREWLGLVISFFGSLLLVFEPTFTGQSLLKSFSFSGNLIILAYNFIIAAYYLTAKKHYQNLPKFFVTSISYSVSLISLLIFLSLINSPTSINLLKIPSVAIAVFYMATLGSIVALTARIYGQNAIEASEASLFQYLQGVVAIPTAFFLLNEVPNFKQLFAIFIIAIGVILAEYRPRKIAR